MTRLSLTYDPLASLQSRLASLSPEAQLRSRIAGMLPPGVRFADQVNPLTEPLPQQDFQSSLKSLGNAVVGGVSAVGNLLDVPGSMVRDLLAGENPLDQLLSPLRFENRTTGQDLLKKWGVVDDADGGLTSGRFWGGLGTEILLDPLLPLTLGSKALSPAGKLASKAGLLDDLAKKAGTVGPREARSRLTLRNLVGEPGAFDKLVDAAGGDASKVRGMLKENKPIGGYFGYGGVPIGTGKVGLALARQQDKLAKAARFSFLGRRIAAAFDPDMAIGNRRAAVSQVGQEMSKEINTLAKRDERGIREFIAGVRTWQREALKTAAEDSPIRRWDNHDWRSALEGWKPDNELPEAIKGLPITMQRQWQTINAQKEVLGIPDSVFDSMTGEMFAPRQALSTQERARLGSVFSADDPHQIARDKFLAHVAGGTKNLDAIIAHPEIARIIDKAEGKAEPAEVIKQVHQFIRERYLGNTLQLSTDEMRRLAGDAARKKLDDHALDLAKFTYYLPKRIREQGLFAGDPLMDAERAMTSASQVIRLTEVVHDRIAKSTTVSRTPSGVTVNEVLKKLFPAGDEKHVKTALTDIAKRMKEKGLLEDSVAVLSKSDEELLGMKSRPTSQAKYVVPTKGFYGGNPSDIGAPNPKMSIFERQLGTEWHNLDVDAIRNYSGTAGRNRYRTIREEVAQEKFGKPWQSLRIPNDEEVTAEALRRWNQEFKSQWTPPAKSKMDPVKMKPKDGKSDEELLAGGAGIGDSTLENIRRRFIDNDLAQSLVRMQEATTHQIDAEGPLRWLWSLTNAFKVAQLTWPSRLVRDFYSGQFVNWAAGMFSGKLVRDVDKLVTGKVPVIPGAKNYPAIKRIFGGRATDDQATQWLMEQAYANNVIARTPGTAEQLDIASRGITGGGGTGPLSVDELTGQHMITRPSVELLGERPFAGNRKILATALGRAEGTSLLPGRGKLRGVGGERVTTLGPVAASELAQNRIEAMNRLAPFLKQIKDGIDPRVAAQKATAAQVDYSPRAYTEFEKQYLKKAFPFYSWISRMIPYTVKELWQQPGGRIAQTIRGTQDTQRALEQEGGVIPERYRKSLGVPLGDVDPVTGQQQILTQLDLAHEGALEPFTLGPTVGGSIGRFARGIAGQMHPLVKTAVETATGQQLYSGRDLESLEGGLERFLTDAASSVGMEARPNIPNVIDNAVTQLLGKTLSVPRQVLDQRDALSEKAVKLPVNLLTGARISTINQPLELQRLSRDALEEQLIASGNIGEFQRPYIKDKERMTPEEIRGMRLYNQLERERQKARQIQEQRARWTQTAP